MLNDYPHDSWRRRQRDLRIRARMGGDSANWMDQERALRTDERTGFGRPLPWADQFFQRPASMGGFNEAVLPVVVPAGMSMGRAIVTSVIAGTALWTVTRLLDRKFGATR